MLFAIGSKVKFLHTGDEGTVKSILTGGMINVYLPKDDMEIPAWPDDLVRVEDWWKHKVKAKVVEGKKTPEPPKAPPVTIQTQYTILKSQGLQMAFEAVQNKEGLTEKFLIHLLNDTNYEVVYAIRFLRNSFSPVKYDGKLGAVAISLLGEMMYDDLNESPEFEIECRWGTTEGMTDAVYKSLKIKAKPFFNSLKTVPFLNKKAHLFRLFEKPEDSNPAKEEDLEAYTKRHAPAKRAYNQSNLKHLKMYDSKELAEFVPEIDLHIEQLVANTSKMSNSDIMRVQLSHFEAFIQKAIMLGVPQVFVIHGVGEGRLRNEIASRLMLNPDVDTFKNEYHHKYGWGATEVVF